MKRYLSLYILLILLSLGIYISANNQITLVIFISLILVLILMIIYAIILKLRVKVSFETTSLTKANEEVIYNIKIDKNTILPVGKITLLFKFNNSLFQKETIDNVDLNLGNDNTYDLKFSYPYCGKVNIELVEVRFYDLLALVSFKSNVNQLENCMVYPSFYNFDIDVNYDVHENSNGDLYLNKKGNDNSQVFDLREYEKGDSVKQIHWKMSSKLDKLIIREFVHPTSFHTMIMFDALFNEFELNKVNAIYGSIISISDALIKLDISHLVGYYDGELKGININNKNDYNQMVDAILASRALESSGMNVDSFINKELYKDITQVIYITNNFDENTMNILSSYTTLTIIVIGDKTSVEDFNNFKVISLESDLENKTTILYL